MKKFRPCMALLPFLVSLEIFVTAAAALASGFAITEQSVRGLGNAFSGSAAAEDASTIFFNPAGLTRLNDSSVVGALYYISPTAVFQNQGSTTVTGASLTGSDSEDGGVGIFVPNFYAAWNLSERVKLGLGVNPPFGLITEYDDDWVGRYQAVKSELITININPTLAAKLTNNLSIGAGINLQYADAELSNAIDFGLIGFNVGLGTRPQTADGFVKLTGDDWSWGYNLGLLYELSRQTRIGLAYRSKITHELEGNADFSVPATVQAVTARGSFTDTGAETVLNLPETISLSAYHQLSPRLAATGDVTWTNWSRFEELRINFDNPAQPDSVTPENWHDTWRFALGLNYDVSDVWELRAGVAYDQSPVEEEFITPRIPDDDRTWLTVGVSFKPSDSLSLDLGYAHLFVNDASINQQSTTNDSDGALRGEFDNSVDIVGVQANWRF